MEYTILKSLGVKEFDYVERYSVRTEGNSDVLKIYYKKKGQLFHKSEKFKFSRSMRSVRSYSEPNIYKEVSEVSPMLTKVMAELDDIVDQDHQEQDAKNKILNDLRHLEKVVQQKIQEIEEQLDRL
ncbi:DUF3461 family protein [Alkalimarinus alittae]|uniref:DUF3461 family protein n=1 Tax=Alkalimarinus alittae TaxID=2961619 RepID=A0ABY6N030_9ALTE|nr:DUF3461 family protein [Alkalimarinus alittae]UZE95446.1 DUF3461 family protein [Alkalimarinus alittae]